MARQYTRWYDKNPEMSKAVQLIEAFPKEIWNIIGEGLILLAERDCQAAELVQSLRSLGAEKVLALYKAKNRRRVWDEDPNLHKAMNYLTLLSDESKDFMANEIIALSGYVNEYIQMCEDASESLSTTKVSEITQMYVHNGPDHAEELIAAVKEEFKGKIQKKIASGTCIQGEESGMRITGEGFISE